MTWTRRDLLKAAGLASAGLALAPPAFARGGGAARAFDALRVPALPAVGALDDALALYAYAVPMPARFAGAVLNHPDLVRTAGLLPATPPDAVALLDAFRADHDAEGAAEKAAFGAGWLAHRAATAELGGAASDEAAVYRAAEVLRDRGRGAGPGDPDDVEALFNAMWHRTMIRLHTLKPDERDVEGWMGRFVAWRREAEARARALAEAVAAPDPAARRRHTAGFYDPADPVVALARRLERHELTAPPPLQAAIAEPGASAYARAVAAATRTLLQATAYVDGTAVAADLVALR